MRTIWLSLFWKEWRENRWKLVALSAAILIAILVAMAWTHDKGLSQFMPVMIAILFCYGFLASLFLGMGGAGKETGAGTAAFLQTLPTPMWKVAIAKLSMISLVAAAPIIALLLVSYLSYRSEIFYGEYVSLFAIEDMEDMFISEIPAAIFSWYAHCALTAILATLSLLIWVAAFGVNRSDEIRAGALGFLGVVSVWFLFGYSMNLALKYQLPAVEHAIAVAASAAPGGPLAWQLYWDGAPGLPQLDRPLPVVCYIGHAAVAVWFLLRFGRVPVGTGRGRNQRLPSIGAWAAKSPFSTQIGAIAWKQIRETGPLAIMALAGIVAIAAFIWWVDSQVSNAFSETFLGVSGTMSFFVVIVAGIGLYLEELRPNLCQFWRSRPMNLGLQFVVKYAAGLIVLVVVLGVPALAAGIHYSNRYAGMNSRELFGAIAYLGWFFVMAYSLAMTSHCLFRQPLYAAIFTVMAIWLGSVAFIWVFDVPHWSEVVAAMLLSLAGTIALGWLAVRNDWGWKR